MQWTWRRSFLLLLVIAMLYFVGVFYIYIFIDQLIFSPVRHPKQYKIKSELPYQEITIDHPNQEYINSYFFKTKQIRKGCILFLQGAGKSPEYWSSYVQNFSLAGFDVLIPEYRGYGRSRFKTSEINMYEDALASVSYLKKICPEDSMMVYGVGLGAVAACYVGTLINPRMIVLQDPVYSIRSWIRNRYPALLLHFELKYDFNIFDYITHCASPIYILRDKLSEECTAEEAKELKSAMTDESRYVELNPTKDEQIYNLEAYKKIINQLATAF